MPPRLYTIRTSNNPIIQVLYFLIGGVLLIGAVIIGGVILAFVFGFAVILGIVIYLRVWWLKRKFAKSGRASGTGPRNSSTEEVIEVEYTVVEERDDRDPPEGGK